MAKNYVCLYHSYLDAIQALGDAERGRLLTAMLEYSITGATGHLSGNERFIFPMIKAQIDRDQEKYDKLCRANAENGARGGRGKADASERQRLQANASEKSQRKGEGKGEEEREGKGKGEREKGTSPPYPPAGGRPKRPAKGRRAPAPGDNYDASAERIQHSAQWLDEFLEGQRGEREDKKGGPG